MVAHQLLDAQFLELVKLGPARDGVQAALALVLDAVLRQAHLLRHKRRRRDFLVRLASALVARVRGNHNHGLDGRSTRHCNRSASRHQTTCHKPMPSTCTSLPMCSACTWRTLMGLLSVGGRNTTSLRQDNDVKPHVQIAARTSGVAGSWGTATLLQLAPLHSCEISRSTVSNDCLGRQPGSGGGG